MPKNPLLGIESEDEVKTDESEDTSQDSASDESEEDEDLEDEASDESEEEEVQEVAPKPLTKAEKAAAKAAAKAAKTAVNPGMSVGTLGDAVIDQSVPVSANGRVYWQALLQSPLVPSIIPPDMLNEDTTHTFCINSLRIIVPKGKLIQVPLMLAQEITQNFKNRL